MDSETQALVSTVAEDLRAVALLSPKLAYMLALGMPLVYRSRRIPFQWDATGAEQPIDDAMFGDKLFQMFWVWDMSYTIRRPDANDGVFGKLEQDYYAARMPYIDVNMRMTGREQFQLTDGYQPIEDIMSPTITDKRKSQCWVLTADSNLSISAINRRAFNADEVPYQLSIVVSGMELSGCELPGCGYDEAVCWLRKKGILDKAGFGGCGV